MKERIMHILKTYWRMLAANAALLLWLFLSLFLLSGRLFSIALIVNLFVVLPVFPVVYGICTRKWYGMVWIPSLLLFASLWVFTLPFFFARYFLYSFFLPVAYFVLSQVAALLADGAFKRIKEQKEKKKKQSRQSETQVQDSSQGGDV